MKHEYPLMEPPFEVVPYNEMTKKQAQQNFEWFVNEIPERIKLLKKTIEESGEQNSDQIDLSVESLIPVWEWLQKRIQVIPKKPEEVEKIKSNLPEWIKVNIRDYTLSSETLVLAMDVSLYFAEVIRLNFPSLYWGFVTRPKSLRLLNRPIILGFNGDGLDTVTVIVNICYQEVKRENKEGLMGLYNVWSKLVK